MGSSSLRALPHDLRREGERLFDLSMWCLGRDVLHPDNLLLRRGLTRERLPAGRRGTSAYCSCLEGGGALTLWGFGVVWHGPAGCVYVPRHGFSPVLVEPHRLEQPLFDSAELGIPQVPGTPAECSIARGAVAGLARWMAGHEEWIESVLGLDWRRTCVAAMSKAPALPGEGLAEAWRRFAARVETLENPIGV
ncbi:MAG: hypothetical protein ABW123_24125 [Cystobacter sp.]